MRFVILLSLLVASVLAVPIIYQDDVYLRRADELKVRKDYLFMVGLVFDGIVCTGSLVSDGYILTAAHCLHQQSEVKAFFGIHSWRRLSQPRATAEQTIGSDNFIIHPEFDYEDYLNDIALIKLSERIILSDQIGIVNLPQENLVDNVENEYVSLSWGISERSPTVLPFLHLMTVELLQCPPFIPVQKSNGVSSIVCSIEPFYRNVFHQDGGDPLILNDDSVIPYNHSTIVAISSIGGIEYGDLTFTNVFFYINWIQNNSQISEAPQQLEVEEVVKVSDSENTVDDGENVVDGNESSVNGDESAVNDDNNEVDNGDIVVDDDENEVNGDENVVDGDENEVVHDENEVVNDENGEVSGENEVDDNNNELDNGDIVLDEDENEVDGDENEVVHDANEEGSGENEEDDNNNELDNGDVVVDDEENAVDDNENKVDGGGNEVVDDGNELQDEDVLLPAAADYSAVVDNDAENDQEIDE